MDVEGAAGEVVVLTLAEAGVGAAVAEGAWAIMGAVEDFMVEVSTAEVAAVEVAIGAEEEDLGLLPPGQRNMAAGEVVSVLAGLLRDRDLPWPHQVVPLLR